MELEAVTRRNTVWWTSSVLVPKKESRWWNRSRECAMILAARLILPLWLGATTSAISSPHRIWKRAIWSRHQASWHAWQVWVENCFVVVVVPVVRFFPLWVLVSGCWGCACMRRLVGAWVCLDFFFFFSCLNMPFFKKKKPVYPRVVNQLLMLLHFLHLEFCICWGWNNESFQ